MRKYRKTKGSKGNGVEKRAEERKIIRLAICLAITFSVLPGCNGKLPLSSSFHAIEDVEMIRTICVDRKEDEILVTACGEPQENKKVGVWESKGKSFGEALGGLVMHPCKELIFSHVDYIVFGENTTGTDICDVLNYGARATEIRLSCKLFRLPLGKAGEIAGKLKTRDTNFTVQLERIVERLPSLAEGQAYSAGETMTSLKETACGLVLLLENANDGVICTNGYQIITSTGESHVLTTEESKGVTLIRNREIKDWMVLQKEQNKILIEYTVSETKLSQSDHEMNISVSGNAEIVEQIGEFPRLEAEKMLAETIEEYILSAMKKETQLEVDFLNLRKTDGNNQRFGQEYSICIRLPIQSEGETLKGEES